MVRTGTLPITGGLLLGDDEESALSAIDRFPISQDQRYTVRARVSYELSPRAWVAVAGSYGSGLPVEFAGERDEAIESLEESLAILESQHERETRDSRARFRLFTQIAAQFAGFEKGERAIEVAEKIIAEGEKTSALSQIAAILTMRKEDEQARHAFRAIADDGNRVFALIAMSDAKEKNGEREAAIDLMDEAAELADSVPQFVMRAQAYSNLADRFGRVNLSARFE